MKVLIDNGHGEFTPGKRSPDGEFCEWSCYTSKGRTKADELATCICNEALKNFAGHHSRTDWSDGDADIEEDFYILKKTRCPAVLTENFFMDNREDLAYITSGEDPLTPVAEAIDIKSDYDTKNGAPSVGAPKVFFKYFYVNTTTGEKSGEMLVAGKYSAE